MARFSWFRFYNCSMFDENVHKNAIKELIAFLRTKTTQKNIAFFCDVSREYIRRLGKGDRIPSIMLFFNMLDAAGIDLNEGANLYIDFLKKQKMALAAERSKGLDYVNKNRLRNGKKKD